MQMAEWKPSGRASDMFSLGCVLLEVVILHDQGTLQHVRLTRSKDPSFHANLDRVDTWLEGPSPKPLSFRRAYLVSEIKSMLANDPEARPTAKELLIGVAGYDQAQMIQSKHSLFGDCCRSYFMSPKEKKREISKCTDTIVGLRFDVQDTVGEQSQKDEDLRWAIRDRSDLWETLIEEKVDFKTESTKEHTNTT
jgi:serine/threonine protein kinase